MRAGGNDLPATRSGKSANYRQRERERNGRTAKSGDDSIGRGADSVQLSFSLVEESQVDEGVERLAALLQ